MKHLLFALLLTFSIFGTITAQEHDSTFSAVLSQNLADIEQLTSEATAVLGADHIVTKKLYDASVSLVVLMERLNLEVDTSFTSSMQASSLVEIRTHVDTIINCLEVYDTSVIDMILLVAWRQKWHDSALVSYLTCNYEINLLGVIYYQE